MIVHTLTPPGSSGSTKVIGGVVGIITAAVVAAIASVGIDDFMLVQEVWYANTLNNNKITKYILFLEFNRRRQQKQNTVAEHKDNSESHDQPSAVDVDCSEVVHEYDEIGCQP